MNYKLIFAAYMEQRGQAEDTIIGNLGIEIIIETPCPVCKAPLPLSVFASPQDFVRFRDMGQNCPCGMFFFPAIYDRLAKEYLFDYWHQENKQREVKKLESLITGGIDPEIYECYKEDTKRGIRKGESKPKRRKKVKMQYWWLNETG